MMNKKLEVILVALLYLFTLYLWTLPIQSTPLPFGDVDSTTHFTIGDWMALNDKSMFNIPYYMTYVLGEDAQGKLVYPPQFNTAEAIAESFSFGRIIPVFIFYAVISSLFVLTSYILIRKLYGFWPAYLSSFFLIFSYRDYMTYLWGMWPQIASFVLTPVVMYSFYQFVSKECKKPIYLYLTVILMITQFAFHPQGIVFSAGFLAIYSLLLIWKQKRFFFPLKTLAFAGILGVVLLLAFAPFQLRIFANKIGLTETGSEFHEKAPLSNLLKWYERPQRNVGVPDEYFNFKDVYGYWVLPLLLLGVGLIIWRRNSPDTLMIAYLITMYLFIHLENIGFPRAHRFLEMEAWLFAPLIVIGLLSVPSIIPESYRRNAKFALIAAFSILTIFLVTVPAYSTLKNAYPGAMRTTEFHMELADWMRENLPEDANVMYVGYTAFAKKKWLRSLSHRNIIYDNPVIPQQHRAINLTDHVLIDYSEALAWTNGDEEAIKELQNWEVQNLANKTLLYEHPSKLARIYSLR
ncbi:MAG TPA: DUF6541 family protein [Candidatus Nanoarchaeia archaeon]|nr:DUF6541 family protein [Candidatus Nanoarchaeia archaeon]